MIHLTYFQFFILISSIIVMIYHSWKTRNDYPCSHFYKTECDKKDLEIMRLKTTLDSSEYFEHELKLIRERLDNPKQKES